MASPMPKYRYKSVLDISVEDLNKMGAKAVALDIDNTICNDGKTNCIDGLDIWLKSIQESGIKVMIISNAMPRRPKIVSKMLNLPYIANAKKPKSHTLIKGAEMMGVKAGLGWYMTWAKSWASYDKMFAALFVICFIFTIVTKILDRIKRHLLRWQNGAVK